MATITETLALAVKHHWASQLQEAEQGYRDILRANPQHVDALHLLGVVASQLGNHQIAVEHISRAIALYPENAAFYSNLGNALKCQGKLVDAAASYRRALRIKPDYAQAYYNLGVVLKEQGKLEEAAASYREAVRIKPDYAEAHQNLGNALKEQGKLEDAMASYRRALEIKPDYAEVHYNLGVVLKEQGKLEEAVGSYGRALEIRPDYASAHWNRSLAWLLAGDFERGCPEYEWRWKTNQFTPRDFYQPLWDGSALGGRSILLHAEQGLGDTLQFIRYATLVKELGAKVIVECQKPLVPILTSCPGIDELVEQGNELPAFDVHAPLLSLPGIFKTSLENIPAPIPYLFAKEDLIEHWRETLSGLDGFKIGINWRGNPEYRADRDRSIPLAQFAPFTRAAGVRLISLQKGADREELTDVQDSLPVSDLGSQVDEASGPFMDTAAIMMNLDLVITCDSAVGHLAGALGVPVWVAIPFMPEWRWFLDRDDSPWYPTMRLFRQSKPTDWTGVFHQMEASLRDQLSP